jgi:hypothetical protein
MITSRFIALPVVLKSYPPYCVGSVCRRYPKLAFLQGIIHAPTQRSAACALRDARGLLDTRTIARAD